MDEISNDRQRHDHNLRPALPTRTHEIQLTDDGGCVLLRPSRSALEHASPTAGGIVAIVLVLLLVVVVITLYDHDGRPAGRLAVLRVALGGLAVLAVVKATVELFGIVVKGLDVDGVVAVHGKLGRLALLLGLDGGRDKDDEEKEGESGDGGPHREMVLRREKFVKFRRGIGVVWKYSMP